MQKSNKNSKRITGKNLTKSLSARISPMPSPQKYPSVCFDIEYLLKKKEHKSTSLKFKAASSTVVSPKYVTPDQSNLLILPKRGNKSVPDSIISQKTEINQAMAYIRYLKERLDQITKENLIFESLSRSRSGKKPKVLKTIEKFKKKLALRLKF
jgi:hypothetical protein